MPEKTALSNPNGVESVVVLVIWLTMIMKIFSPWGDYVSQTEHNLLNSAPIEAGGASRAILILHFSCILLLSVLNLKKVLKALWLALPILILAGWILLSTSWSPDPSVSFRRAVFYLFEILFCCYVASRYGSREYVALLTKGFALLMFASLAVMILFPNLGYSAGYSTGLGGDDGSAWRGAFIQKNALGSAASFGAIFSWYSYITRTNSRFLSAATFLACIFLLAMSRSVTATMATMAAGLAAVIAWAIQSQERAGVFRSFALVALCILVMFLMVLPLTDFSPNHLPGLAGRSGTLTGRTDIWRAVAAEIRDRPLTGHGYAFWDIPSVARRNIWLSVGWTPEDAHDDWMETLLQIGLVGVLITTFIWFSAFRRSIWLIFVRHKNGTLLYFTILVSYFFQGLTETVSLPPGTGLLFWWVTSYIYIASNNRERSAAKMSTAIGGVGTGIDQPALQPAARTL